MSTLFLMGALTFAAGGDTGIDNAQSLVDREWGQLQTITKHQTSGRGYSTGSRSRRSSRYRGFTPRTTAYTAQKATLLSLRPGDQWSQGKAWIITAEKNPENLGATAYQAFKGVYTFYNDPQDRDNLILQIGFTRKYTGNASGERIVWNLDSGYEKRGARIDIPLEERMVPFGEITFSVVSGFFVDSSGQRTIRRYEPSGFLERLSGIGQIKKVRNTEFVGLGETLQLKERGVANLFKTFGLDQSPPPSFKPHTK